MSDFGRNGTKRRLWSVAAACIAWGQGATVFGADGPILGPQGLMYPEGAAVSRDLTEPERLWIEDHPIRVSSERAATPPSSGPVRCPGEYEPCQGILLAWEPSSGSIGTILATMVKEITTTGAARAYIMVDSSSEQTTVTTTLSGAGADMSRVEFHVSPTDTIWIRDYGPRYIYQGDCRAIVDHTYNRPRPNDDAQPSYWATAKHLPRYAIPLIHGGGNYHLNGLGESWCTELIWNENAGLTHQQVHDHWAAYQNVDTTVTTPFPTSVDSTQHIDMWMQIFSDDGVMISDWATPPAATPNVDVTCDGVASAMAGSGWTVRRVPAFSVGGVHYTYTNVVMCNDLVLIPSYTNTTVVNAGGNSTALAQWQAACPGKTVVQVPCQAIVGLAGVMHCIAMHVPAPVGGALPTAHLQTLVGPETLQPGAQADIRWITDDDSAVANVDILFSSDGGASYPTILASATADDGSFLWTVPNQYVTQGRIRIVARDAQGNLGWDQSAADLVINAPPPICPGDADGNHAVNFADITAVLANWGANPGTPYNNGDADGNGAVEFADITFVLANWSATCS